MAHNGELYAQFELTQFRLGIRNRLTLDQKVRGSRPRPAANRQSESTRKWVPPLSAAYSYFGWLAALSIFAHESRKVAVLLKIKFDSVESLSTQK